MEKMQKRTFLQASDKIQINLLLKLRKMPWKKAIKKEKLVWSFNIMWNQSSQKIKLISTLWVEDQLNAISKKACLCTKPQHYLKIKICSLKE